MCAFGRVRLKRPGDIHTPLHRDQKTEVFLLWHVTLTGLVLGNIARARDTYLIFPSVPTLIPCWRYLTIIFFLLFNVKGTPGSAGQHGEKGEKGDPGRVRIKGKHTFYH